MHTRVFLLIAPQDTGEKLSNLDIENEISDFMEPYGEGKVWDWYEIGGRWNNALAPKNKMEAFTKELEESQLFKKHEFGGYLLKDVEAVKDKIQAIWEKQGLLGKNPYWNHYGLEGTNEPYNIVPLKDCLDIVKEACIDLEKLKAEYLEKMLQEVEKEKEMSDSTMSGYYAGLYKDVCYGSFSFETGVYNITEDVAEIIPKNITDYYAVVVDMHN